MATPALAVHGLTKRYGSHTALGGVSLEVGEDEVLGLLGANGAGKTTFTKCVTGFLRPDAGGIRVFGLDAVRDPGTANRAIGVVPDVYSLYPAMTGREHLRFYGGLHGLAGTKLDDRIEAVADLARLGAFIDRRAKTYSHGMQQRTCIAQALLHEPRLVLFDEPSNGLDPAGAAELRTLIRGLADEGTAVVLNSHLLHEVNATCDRVAVLQAGRLLTVENTAELAARAAGSGEVEVRVLRDVAGACRAAANIVGQPVAAADGVIRFSADEATAADAIGAIAAAGCGIVTVARDAGDLETAFLHLTQPDATPMAVTT